MNTTADKLEEEIKETLLAQEEFTIRINPFDIHKKVNFAPESPEERINKAGVKPKNSPFRTYLNILSALEIKNRGDELADIKDICFEELELSVEDIINVVKKRPELTTDEYPPLTETEVISKQELENAISKLLNL